MVDSQFRATGQRPQNPSESAPVRLVLLEVADALRLVSRTEQAYRCGDRRAPALQAAVDYAHTQLLSSICALTEEEADSVEPLFTEFEVRMLRLPGAPNAPSLTA